MQYELLLSSHYLNTINIGWTLLNRTFRKGQDERLKAIIYTII